jgi:cytochrome c-type biogenesis protein CcmF
MAIELGHFALILAFALATVSGVVGFALWRRGEGVALLMRYSAGLQLALVAGAFAALVQAFVTSDFSVALVANHSHSLKPLLFKVTGLWGNHEGSLLLWILILVLFGAMVALFARSLPAALTSLTLATQSVLAAAFAGFALFTSNPFWRLSPTPLEGADLNPVLQDFGLAVHPPLLYAGYVGFSICFSFAVAALVSGRIDAAWARWVRPWTVLSWVFLTLGIAMGSYWAYYELGWGGWWFWDPVENASFMPWLAGTALLHSAIVMEKRNALKIWTIFLAIVTFALSLLGTFLVRSGILTSVHSFASDPTRGMVILAMLALIIGAALALFALRASALRAGGLFAPISREGALVLNNLFLATATGAILVGTLYPLVLDALTGRAISVGAPFFDLTFSALMSPLLLVLPFGQLLAWKRGDIVAAAQRLIAAAALAIFLAVLIAALGGVGISLAPIGLMLGFWVIFGAVTDLVERGRIGRIPLVESVRRLVGLPRSAWGAALGHIGLGITVLGIVAVTAWEVERVTTLDPGETVAFAGYELRLDRIQERQGANYVAEVGVFTVSEPGRQARTLRPERRIYLASGTPTTEAAISTYGFSQLYLQLGEPIQDTHVVRMWYKPYVTLIWLGAVVMALGGGLSLSDRKLRVGRPARLAARPAQ